MIGSDACSYRLLLLTYWARLNSGQAAFVCFYLTPLLAYEYQQPAVIRYGVSISRPTLSADCRPIVLVPNSTTRTPAPNTGYGHQQRTSSRQFYNLLYNSHHQRTKICHIPTYWALALRCGKFVVELLWARPLVVSVGGAVQHVRSRCPCSGVWLLQWTKSRAG